MNLDINVTLNVDGTLLAFLGQIVAPLLAPAQKDAAVPPSSAAPVPPAPAPVAPASAAPAPSAPVAPPPASATPAPAPVTSSAAPVPPASAPVAPAPAPTAPTVPTAPTPGYTLEQLSRAGADLTRSDPTKMAQLIALMQQYGVQTVSQLPPEHYGAFATALRGLGATI